MTDKYNDPEAQQILPGELSDNQLIQEAYTSLNNSLQEKLSDLKAVDPDKHYFHSVIGNRMTSMGGKEIEIKIEGTQTRIEFNYRGAYDDSDSKALERINAVSLILKSDILTGGQTANLQFFRDGNKHSWKAKSHGSNYEISFHQEDANSKDIANALSVADIDCLSLLSKQSDIKSANKPPQRAGLMIKPGKKGNAKWN